MPGSSLSGGTTSRPPTGARGEAARGWDEESAFRGQAVEAMAEKLRREADRFLSRRSDDHEDAAT